MGYGLDTWENSIDAAIVAVIGTDVRTQAQGAWYPNVLAGDELPETLNRDELHRTWNVLTDTSEAPVGNCPDASSRTTVTLFWCLEEGVSPGAHVQSLRALWPEEAIIVRALLALVEGNANVTPDYDGGTVLVTRVVDAANNLARVSIEIPCLFDIWGA